jgi:hypothetical protein
VESGNRLARGQSAKVTVGVASSLSASTASINGIKIAKNLFQRRDPRELGTVY